MTSLTVIWLKCHVAQTSYSPVALAVILETKSHCGLKRWEYHHKNVVMLSLSKTSSIPWKFRIEIIVCSKECDVSLLGPRSFSNWYWIQFRYILVVWKIFNLFLSTSGLFFQMNNIIIITTAIIIRLILLIIILKAEVHKEKQSLNPFSDSFDADKLRKLLTNKVGNQRW